MTIVIITIMIMMIILHPEFLQIIFFYIMLEPV